MLNFEISGKELRAIAHNSNEAIALQEQIDRMQEELSALKQQKRELVDSLVESEEFIAKAKAAKLQLINETVMKLVEERGADAVLNALSRPMPTFKPQRRESAPVTTTPKVEVVTEVANTAESATAEAEEVLYEECNVLIPELNEEADFN